MTTKREKELRCHLFDERENRILGRTHELARPDPIMNLILRLGRDVSGPGHESLKDGLHRRQTFHLVTKQLDYDLYLKLYDIYVNDFNRLMFALHEARWDELKRKAREEIMEAEKAAT